MAPDAMDSPNNPYAPPKAPVADAVEEAAEKCPHVELACRLLWASFAIGMLANVVALFTVAGGAALVAGVLIGQVIGLGIGVLILVWITRKLRAGRNWMRWLLTTLTLLSWLSIAAFWEFFRNTYATMIATNPVGFGGTVIQGLIGIAFIILLHTPVSRAWFRAQSLRRTA